MFLSGTYVQALLENLFIRGKSLQDAEVALEEALEKYGQRPTSHGALLTYY